MGFGHRGAALIEYLAMLGCAGAALVAREANTSTQYTIVLGAAIALGLIAAWIDLRWLRFVREGGSAK